MATTTNFGWETPDDTDLVKDGAAAIRTLGQSIDTSLMDLEGGTTGQILAKNSNTDMDFTWITNDVGDITAVTAGTGISGGGTSGAVTVTNSMATAIDAKGDLIGGTGADTFARLAVGANGTVLTADSGETTGLIWATPAALAPASATGSGTATSSTTSATYVDTSAAATLTTGTKALVLIGATVAFNNSSEESTFISFKVSGATTSAATDARGAQFFTSAANRPKVGLSRAILITGLTAGSNVFTLQIRVSAGTGGVDTGYNVAVIDMGS
jgi:hypothetical protein